MADSLSALTRFTHLNVVVPLNIVVRLNVVVPLHVVVRLNVDVRMSMLRCVIVRLNA